MLENILVDFMKYVFKGRKIYLKMQLKEEISFWKMVVDHRKRFTDAIHLA